VPYSRNRIVVIGASAGGLEVLKSILGALDPAIPATVLLALHLSPTSPGYLPHILQRDTQMPVRSPVEERLERGVIYVAPPDRHLTLQDSVVRATYGPKENHFRPSIDVLFRSAALTYREAVIGVVLSGLLDDGTAGLFYVKRHGGIAIVQDPRDAEFPSMPENALAHVQVDHVARAGEIGALINRLSREPIPMRGEIFPHGASEAVKRIFVRRPDTTPSENAILEEDEKLATPAMYTCPDCGGTLFELQDSNLLRFRCSTGHAYGMDSLSSLQAEGVEMALQSAAKAFVEEISLLDRAAKLARAAGDGDKARKIEEQIAHAKERSDELERIIAQAN
jgi:two-component system chemotaxis response regulator CheB